MDEYKGLPIWKGYPHSTSILINCFENGGNTPVIINPNEGEGGFGDPVIEQSPNFGIQRILDYDGISDEPVTMDYTDEFITNHCGGVYIKFLNHFAGYSYWLFSHVFSEENRVKTLGNITNHWDQLALATSTYHHLGNESQDTLALFSRIKNKYVPELRALTDSPEVYLYTPSISGWVSTNQCDWIKVRVKNTRIPLLNTKNKTVTMQLDIEMPKRYTQTLI